jgi:hypothetical protein
MFGVFRPSFEVVKEGRILKKVRHLQKVFFLRQVLGGFQLKLHT